ncbi:MAG: hypothetical protein AAF732_19420 [Pseudomonadota bacterium]
MADDFETHAPGVSSPVSSGEAIVPDDIAELTHFTRVLYVGNEGNIRVKLTSGDEVTLRSVQAGAMYPVRVRQVFATGTTASNIVGMR